MKVICKQQDLARGLTTVSHAVSSRSTLPILANILVVTESDRIRLTATNLEVGITCWVPAEVQEEGTTTVPAKLFTEFVATLPSSSGTFTTASSRLYLSAGIEDGDSRPVRAAATSGGLPRAAGRVASAAE